MGSEGEEGRMLGAVGAMLRGFCGQRDMLLQMSLQGRTREYLHQLPWWIDRIELTEELIDR